MYEELVKALRNVSEYDSGYAKLMYDAADAIEELQKRIPKRPHGRLIDADALWNEIVKTCEDDINNASVEDICIDILYAPTVIPAEEGET